jgi:hypothetical protein
MAAAYANQFVDEIDNILKTPSFLQKKQQKTENVEFTDSISSSLSNLSCRDSADIVSH